MFEQLRKVQNICKTAMICQKIAIGTDKQALTTKILTSLIVARYQSIILDRYLFNNQRFKNKLKRYRAMNFLSLKR
jgi:hypothetical protein